MSIVNIHAAKTHLSRLVEKAAAGEEIIIAKAGTPLAKLGPLAPAGGGRPTCLTHSKADNALVAGTPMFCFGR